MKERERRRPRSESRRTASEEEKTYPVPAVAVADMDVPSTQAPEHVPDDVLDLAVPSADVSLTPPLMGANAPARLSLTKLALHPANTEDAWNGGIRPHRPATEPATTPVSPDGPYGMEVRVVAGGSCCPRVLGGRHRGCRAVGAFVLRRPPPPSALLFNFPASFGACISVPEH